MNGRREVDYDLLLEDDEGERAEVDLVRVHWISQHSRVIAFTTQYEAYIEDRYYPAERYDTAHGHAHRDSLDWDGNVIYTRPLPETMDYNEALTYAINNLRTRWRTYRAAFLRRKP